LRAYVAFWATACLVAVALLAVHRRRLTIGRPDYWRFLCVPWKLATFVVAASGVVLVAPFTGDPTWDYVDGAFMSILAFATAPWVVGVFYRAVRHRVMPVEVFVAVCAWLFSASWSYDLYLLLRDGYYPVTWAANLVASSVLYLAAGLFWSLDTAPSGGWVFAFTDDAWPRATSVAFSRVLWPALLLMAVVTVMMVAFAIGWTP
jgi:hypothetical protein